MKAIIFGPADGGNGTYVLLTEEGEPICSHFCSHRGFAEGDLFRNRPERKELFESYNIDEFVWTGGEFSREEMIKRNQEWFDDGAKSTVKEEEKPFAKVEATWSEK